jgi:aldehyde:ferredoxin oxidoreductase
LVQNKCLVLKVKGKKMKLKGVLHKIAWIDLTKEETSFEEPPESVYKDYLGGYGVGAYYLFTRQRPGADPLGPENILGFLPGPLTGTPAIGGNRFTVVAKSPKTGGWGDANSGGRFGPALKQAGVDAVFITGVSEEPVYVLIEKGQARICKADLLWGLGVTETENRFKELFGKQAHAAVIGPAGEKKSLMSCIINDGGRAAARSGLGAVMGSKRLKGVVAIGSEPVYVAEEEKLKIFRRKLLKEYYNKDNTKFRFFQTWGTAGGLEPNVTIGDTPVKNWKGSVKDFSKSEKISGEALLKFKTKSYGCWMCPVVCGAKIEVSDGPYAVKGYRPEYETLAAFGPLCQNDNPESICLVNTVCNEAGIDTISTGATIAFAIECFENNLLTKEDTNGIDLLWGNHEAIVELVKQIAEKRGFGGEVLFDGIEKAAEKIGKGSEEFAMHCGGEELPFHDPRFFPGLAASYITGPAPGRHTEYGSWFAEKEMVPPELGHPKIKNKYDYSGKGESYKYVSCFGQVVNSAGLCFFLNNIGPATAVPEYLSLVMGKAFSLEDVLIVGERILTLRIAFNLREGIKNVEKFSLPKRVLGDPQLKDGPFKEITVDSSIQIKDYYNALGWNPDTGVPSADVFERLGLCFAAYLADI